MTYVSQRRNMPEGPHYAIISFSSIYIPGDERSRTNPGHGYPAHNQPTVQYQAFDNREEWEKEIRKLEDRTGYGQGQYIAGYFSPARVERAVQISGAP